MNVHSLGRSPSGRLVATINGQMAFVPNPLPRKLDFTSGTVFQLDEASRAMAMLAGVGETIPNPHLLIRPFVRREAVLSSRIEGTQASLSDLFLFEASGRGRAKGDVFEVANYVRALEHGIQLLGKLPISVRLMNEIHDVLLRGVRGQEKKPGELRDKQNWIGSAGTPIEEARYVPPPAKMVRDLLLDLEYFCNEEITLPPLVQCALMHYQFEAIHPYFDGNGRIGRLLIVLFLCWKRVLSQPLLYLSAYFDRDRSAYYDQLLAVSATGNWEAWLSYFFKGVAEQAQDAVRRIRSVRDLQAKYRQSLQELQRSANALRLVDELFASPFMTIGRAARTLEITPAGAGRILERLAEAGVVELMRGSWPRVYVARELLHVIEQPEASG